MQKIIYITGYGRSGSTLLDICLSQSPRLVGLGEITNFFEEWEALENHPFWSKLIDDFKSKVSNDPVRCLKITREVEALPSFLLSRSQISFYDEIWLFLLKKVMELNGDVVLVDSSKTARLALFRPRRIEALGYDVKLVRLSREKGNVFKSFSKGSNKDLEKGRKSWKFYRIAKSTLGYLYTMLSTKIVYRNRGINLRYEDFLKSPADTLNHIMRSFDINDVKYGDKMFVDMNPGIGISGNRMRRLKNITLEKR